MQAHKGERLEESKAALFASPIASDAQRSRQSLTVLNFKWWEGLNLVSCSREREILYAYQRSVRKCLMIPKGLAVATECTLLHFILYSKSRGLL